VVNRANANPVSRERGPDSDGDRSAGRVGLLVSDRCSNLIRELLGYKEEHVGKSQVTDHCLDSLRYGYMGVATTTASGPSGTGTW